MRVLWPVAKGGKRKSGGLALRLSPWKGVAAKVRLSEQLPGAGVSAILVRLSPLVIAVMGLLAVIAQHLPLRDGATQAAVLLPPWDRAAFARVAETGLAILDLRLGHSLVVVDLGPWGAGAERLRAAGLMVLSTEPPALCSQQRDPEGGSLE